MGEPRDAVLRATAGDYEIDTDRTRVDVDRVHRWLCDEAYWALGRDRSTVERSVAGSVVAGAYAPDGTQVAIARAVTDDATFAWICDVFVDAAHRGRGLGSALVQILLAHPSVAPVKRVVLATADAHEVYRRQGFTALPEPDRWMLRPGPGK